MVAAVKASSSFSMVMLSVRAGQRQEQCCASVVIRDFHGRGSALVMPL